MAAARSVRFFKTGGREPCRDWLDALPAEPALEVTLALRKLEAGLVGRLRSVGGGVHEYKIHVGPGYRVYFGNDGQRTIMLLAGGAKQTQAQDIATAKTYWQDYLARKAKRKRA